MHHLYGISMTINAQKVTVTVTIFSNFLRYFPVTFGNVSDTLKVPQNCIRYNFVPIPFRYSISLFATNKADCVKELVL